MIILGILSKQRGKALTGSASFNYIIKPTPSGALILEATATELIQFSPFSVLNGAAQMEAKYVIQNDKAACHIYIYNVTRTQTVTLQIYMMLPYSQANPGLGRGTEHPSAAHQGSI